MKMLKMGLYLVMLLAVILSFSTGCGQEKLVGTIKEAGSTTVQPVADKLALEFMNRNPNVNVIIQGGGTNVGIQKAADSSVDIGAASSNLKPEDPKLLTCLIGHDGIAIVVHPSNPVNNLTKDQVAKIFSGEIKNWRDLGGNDSKIIIINRESGSGTRNCFEAIVMGKIQITDEAIVEPSNGDVRAQVSTTPAAIGFLSLGYLDTSTKALAINSVACTLENCKSNQYPIVRPLYFLTKDKPSGVVKAFLDFSLSPDGQKIVRDEGYLSKD